LVLAQLGTDLAPVYEPVGKGQEEMNVAMGGDASAITDVLGNTEINQTPYSKTMSVDGYKLDGNQEFTKKIVAIYDDELINDDATIPFIFVNLFESEVVGEVAHYKAFRQNGHILLTDFGGDTTGILAAHNITFVGERESGYVTVTAGVYTFTAD
jgi:hypothetical protein